LKQLESIAPSEFWEEKKSVIFHKNTFAKDYFLMQLIDVTRVWDGFFS